MNSFLVKSLLGLLDYFYRDVFVVPSRCFSYNNEKHFAFLVCVGFGFFVGGGVGFFFRNSSSFSPSRVPYQISNKMNFLLSGNMKSLFGFMILLLRMRTMLAIL